MAKLGMTIKASDAPEPPPGGEAWRRFYDDAINSVRNAHNGGRNVILNQASFKVGRVVAGKFVSEERAKADLMSAARMIGLSTGEAAGTIASGMKAGFAQPFEENAAPSGAKRPWFQRAPTTAPAANEPSPIVAELEEEKRQKAARANRTFEGGLPLEGSRGASYLANRGVTLIDPNVRYSTNFEGLVIPLRTPEGELTCVQHIPVNRDLTRGDKKCHGPMKNAVYRIDAAIEGGPYVVLDGPEDAMAAHQATGWCVMATCGKSRIQHAADHIPDGATVIIVRDRDGTDGSEYRKAEVRMRQRLMNVLFADPPEPAKDVNDLTKIAGDDGVLAWLKEVYESREWEPAVEPDLLTGEPQEAVEVVDEADANPTPLALPEPKGLLKQIRDHITQSALYPHPILSLGAALVILGTAAGRRYSFDHNIRTNLYVLGLAPSSSGKGHVIDSVERILQDSGLDHCIGGKEPASGAAVVSRILEQPVTTYAIDEFGMLLRAMTDPRAPVHLRDITKNWTEIYTKSAGRFADKDRADRSSAQLVVHQPCLSIFGITNAVHVWQAVTPDNMADGSLARFLVLETDENYPKANRRRVAPVTPQWIRDQLRAVVENGLAKDAGNLSTLAIAVPKPREIKATDAAVEMLWELVDEEVELKRANEKTGLAPIYGRMVEQTKKLALIHAIGRDSAFCEITEDDVEWARDTVKALIAQLVANLAKHVARNEHERAGKEIIRLVRQAGSAGLPMSELTRRTQWLKGHERNDIMAALIESGEIVIDERRIGRGRPTSVVRALKKRTSQKE